MLERICKKYESKLLVVAVFAVTVYAFLHAFVWMQYYLPEFEGQSTVEFVAGTGHKPFIYRALVPQTAHAIDSVLPSGLKSDLGNLGRFIEERFVEIGELPKPEAADRDDDYFRLRLITGALMFLFLAGYGAGLFKLAEFFYPDSPSARHVAPLVGYSMLPVGLWQCSYMYDPATLCFAAWCFYLMMTAQWRRYLIVFALACLNKETALYITLVYAVCLHDTLDKPRFLRVLFMQLAIFVVVVAGVRASFFANGGQLVESHWREYLYEWTKTVAPQMKLAMLSGLFLLMFRWPEKPLMLRRSIGVVALATLAWIAAGRSEELRGLYDIYPYLALLVTHTMTVATGIDKAPFFSGQRNTTSLTE